MRRSIPTQTARESDPTLEAHGNTAIFAVDESSDLPIWVQLRNRISYLIKTNYFKAGTQLPSIRTLAAEAGINYNTVTRSFRDLEQSGLIVSVRGRGMFVRERDATNKTETTEPIDSMLEDCIRRYRSSGMTFEETRGHIDSLVVRMEAEALREASKKRGPVG